MSGDSLNEATYAALDAVGERLRRRRQSRGLTLSEVADHTGFSTSTLSRLESGQRRASLELLLPLAALYRVPLDDLVGAPQMGDPRIFPKPRRKGDLVVVPLTHHPGPQQAFKMVIPTARSVPALTTHEGHEWLYVLSGVLRLIVGERDLTLPSGHAAEFDTRAPHWFGSTGEGVVEILSLLSGQGEKIHLTSGD
ncbi:helix-turn-helix domain-containing protein [Pseudonocardia acaciae]|uniref:helix-turn-helix domain-containing protein n=1 Tax=Pseudonocardia acaciae TaxID=551276 RepID=UPI001FE1CCCB|nr:helix-turn-helix domain-containing protein [Pseudonocardia acaciae]